MQSVLEIIEEEQASIARSGAGNAYQYTGSEHVTAFGKRLEAHAPFNVIADSWIASPMGGGRSGLGISGRWVWHQLLSGRDAESILQSAQQDVNRNSYNVIEIRPVKGISVEKVEEITQTASLVPNEQLRKGWPHQLAFGNPILGPRFPSTSAALVQAFKVEPAIHASAGKGSIEASRGREQRERFAAYLRLALGLASGSAVEIPLVYTNSDSILGQSDSMSQTPTATHFGNDVPVDIERTKYLLSKLHVMQAPRALELAIDRLLRSRLSRSLEDRIIDLGMAAEIALMHSVKGVGDGKSEITNKLSARGAWLVGTDPTERLRISKDLGDLYAARSVVVHTGAARGQLQNRVREFDGLASRILLAILERGAFPDWKSLVLGGEGK